jgi:hypothetical protein
MEKGSHASGLLGAIGGICLALLAIFIGSGVARMLATPHEPPGAHSTH